ncbi:hypothetical protein [Planktothricoides raciborskii]|uniref:Uncharacterized protein n=2 Tax=Planktothricoides raciborskii TaxID=132608 RepID=A0AAU8JFM9_9CYAN|nr:hypothetical protein [Planktothricoides raciborskii]MBD2544020.1 hypothetical protein [Planktothricoides raciborskii FACHB-1370]MBD2582504.1 hypothetical protein [Planktothricoides raciborskii FACHB-1261]
MAGDEAKKIAIALLGGAIALTKETGFFHTPRNRVIDAKLQQFSPRVNHKYL